MLSLMKNCDITSLKSDSPGRMLPHNQNQQSGHFNMTLPLSVFPLQNEVEAQFARTGLEGKRQAVLVGEEWFAKEC